jgi:type VI protein secretion system component VasK
MRPGQFNFSVFLALTAILLVGGIIWLSEENRQLEAKLRAQVNEIGKGTMSRQVGLNLIRDMASVASKNARIREILLMNGYTVSEAASEPIKRP